MVALRISALDVQGLLNAGASVEIDAAHFSQLDRIGFANSVKAGSQLRIVNSIAMSQLDRLGLANAGKGRVVFA